MAVMSSAAFPAWHQRGPFSRVFGSRLTMLLRPEGLKANTSSDGWLLHLAHCHQIIISKLCSVVLLLMFCLLFSD